MVSAFDSKNEPCLHPSEHLLLHLFMNRQQRNEFSGNPETRTERDFFFYFLSRNFCKCFQVGKEN